MPTGTRVAQIMGMSLRTLFFVALAGCIPNTDTSEPAVLGLSGTAANDVWAIAGDSNKSSSRVLHFDGHAWSEVSSIGDDAISRIFANAPNDVWAASQFELHHFDGANWSTTALQEPLVAMGPDWAVGIHGLVLARQGDSWSTVVAPSMIIVHAAWGVDAADLWGAIEGSMRHFDGHQWELPAPVVGGSGGMGVLWGTSRDDIWAAGQGIVLHYDGQTWTNMDLHLSTSVTAFWGPAKGDVWATGGGDLVLHNWSKVAGSSSATLTLTDIWGSSSSDIWICGQSPSEAILRHFDGTSWTSVSVP